MACWSDLVDEVNRADNPLAFLNEKRNGFINDIMDITGRNVIAYYSGWLKNPEAPHVAIDENDKNAFMTTIYEMKRDKGLDLILHTPGGDIAATESIVSYLKSMFKNDIRAFVPQISMSAGTMIAMSCKEIVMGEQSSLGPIDPQLGGVACQAVLDEFDSAVREIEKHPSSLGLWQVIISKYHPTFLTSCENAIKWSKQLAETWLKENDPSINMDAVYDKFLNHRNSYSHNRHISKDDCNKVGLNIKDLEENQKLQDAVLSLHHCYMIFFDKYSVSKVVESSTGRAYIQNYSAKK